MTDEITKTRYENLIETLTWKDCKAAAAGLSKDEIGYLVSFYYSSQENRKRSANQLRQAVKSGEPCLFLHWVSDQFILMEGIIKKVLAYYLKDNSRKVDTWAQSITGIGPVITAGLMSHIDFEKAKTAGHIWSFAGLNPKQVWEKGCKRPFNADLKTLCWKIGESFVKVSGNENDIYGKMYYARKEYEQNLNEQLAFKEQAAISLARLKKKNTDTYKCNAAGKLSPGHIHARAKRYAVKMFLSHYFEVGYEEYYKEPAPKPYVIEHLGHTHWLKAS